MSRTFQHVKMLPEMTVLENVALGGYLRSSSVEGVLVQALLDSPEVAPIESPESVGLGRCSGAPPQVVCWGDKIPVKCNTETGFWVVKTEALNEELFAGASRTARSTECSAWDCDDQCPKRCAGLDEGCDGIITQATFVLHRMPPAVRTVCLEFFGQVSEAVPSIVEIKRYVDGNPDAILAGLEHLDARYVKAVGYATKSRRAGRPKMVLVGDIVGENEDAVAAAASQVVRIANARGGEGFIAVSAESRKTFWLDRARTAAIARHTNAFKINEDVVIPLERLGDYSDGIERINIELSIRNKLRILDAAAAVVAGELPVQQTEPGVSAADVLGDRVERAQTLIAGARDRWTWLLAHMDELADTLKPAPHGVPEAALQRAAGQTLFHALQDHSLRVSWKEEVRSHLADIFSGRPFAKVSDLRGH